MKYMRTIISMLIMLGQFFIASACDKGSMTYRVNPVSGDSISMLGYGCMRWPMIDNPDGDGKIVDQERVDSLVAHAIANGVNYFDCSPAYLGGKAEAATGIALKPYPRSSYHLATKMSNHWLAKNGLKGKELYDASIEMYNKSHDYFNTDYFDYYLIHNAGFENRGLSFLKARVFDNGLIDFLMEERKAGRIRNLGFSFHGESKEVFDYLMSRHDDVHWDFAQIRLNYYDFDHIKNELTARDLYEELTRRGIPVIVMEPIMGGKLAKLPDDVTGELKESRPDDSIASWGFRFAGTLPNVFTILSGMTYMEHLEDNLDTFSPFIPLSSEEQKLLDKVTDRLVDMKLF